MVIDKISTDGLKPTIDAVLNKLDQPIPLGYCNVGIIHEIGKKDTATIQLNFEDGSTGTIHYYSNGSKNFPKERLEIFSGGGVLQLDNYRKLTGYGWPGFKKMNLWQQDKGQRACVKSFIDAIIKGDKSPIPIEEVFEVSKISIKLANQ